VKDREKLKKLKQLGEKYSKATEFFDPLIVNGFDKLPFLAKKLINQIGDEILEIIDG
jgi:hypothetical protein